jgi:hypothetical protein
MIALWRIIGLGAVAVLVFDTVASFASIALRFPYAYAWIGSCLIYATVGYVVFRRWNLVRAIGAAMLIGLVDATLGWFVSWQIGPGALPAGQISTSILAITLVFVVIYAALCAGIGSAVARVLPSSRSRP